jgi:hypothetical protein
VGSILPVPGSLETEHGSISQPKVFAGQVRPQNMWERGVGEVSGGEQGWAWGMREELIG